MTTPTVYESEYRFCLVLWKNEPITCAQLAALCKEKLGWSRTTTYTVIKRLSERGVVKNENSVFWVSDVNGLQHGVPNYLTGRQFNVKLMVDIK